MNYAVAYLVGILVLSTLYWIIRGKKHYTGPPLHGHSVAGFLEPRKSNDEEANSKREN